jgi:glycosyltransferase involved in cell wall biosynthesis
MKRIAYASPVNPVPSGISDYSEELLPYLGRYADLTLYLDDGLKPANPALAAHLEVRPLRQLERDQRRRRYDAILYHLGNSSAHMQIWRAMRRTPGIAVLHEIVLHHFMLQYYANELGDVERYKAEATRRYGAEGERIASLMMRGRFNESAFEFPFSEEVLELAEGLIAHSRYVLDHAARMRPNLPSAHVPMGVPLPPAIDRASARQRRGLPLDAPILASFGHINPYKRLEPALRAVRTLLPDLPNLRYILVGSISPSYDARAVIARLGLEQVVQVTGYVDRAAFEQYVAAADVCLNLRHPTAGETSASLLRLLGAGRATLVTSSGSFTELPPGVAAQVDPDASEEELIQGYCRLLLQQPAMADALGQAARAYVAREHTLDRAAQGYMRFLSQRYGWPDQPANRAPLWEVEPPTTADLLVQRQSVAQPQPVPRPDHPVAEQQPAEARAAAPLIQRTATALAELGTTEYDTTLLQAAARALKDVG